MAFHCEVGALSSTGWSRCVLLTLLCCDSSFAIPIKLNILDFGAVPDGETNNEHAISKAVARCEQEAGCELLFPAGRGGSAVTYRTTGFNLTSHMRIVVDVNVTLRGTETDADNCAPNATGYCTGNSWPILPYMDSPVPDSGGVNSFPSYQAWARAVNVTDVEITGGGTLHGGGEYWWCMRATLPGSPTHPPKWCTPQYLQRKPKLTVWPGPMIHFLDSKNIRLANLTIMYSPMFTVYLTECQNVTIDHVYIYNPVNTTYEAPNSDGIDIDSSRDVLVQNSILAVGDDMTAVDSGVDFKGRLVNRSSSNILFQDLEVRTGHGLTVGSGASGGVFNATWRRIWINGGKLGAVGGPHFKTQRGRGGVWDGIVWEDIWGDSANIDFSMDHIVVPPTNASATPVIRNMVVRNVMLKNVRRPPVIDTLAESPIQNLTLQNITLLGQRGWVCRGLDGMKRVAKIFASGKIQDVSPPLGRCDYTLQKQFII